MYKQYMTRSQSRAWSIDNPVGDPYGGAAYGEKNDPVTAIIGGAAITAGAGLIGAGQQADAAQSAANTSAEASRYSADIQKQIYDQTRKDQTPWRDVGGSALNQLASLAGIARPNETLEQITARLSPKYTNTTASQNALKTAAQTEYNRQISAARNAPGFGSAVRDFGMTDYQADPGYGFRLSEGEKALERSAAARGGLYSGRAMKDMARFSQGLASDEYQNAFNRFNTNKSNQYNRLASLAGVGQTANAALGQAGQAYAGSVGNLAMTNAANQGNAALVGGNARASAYSGVGNALGGINWDKMFGSGNYFNAANEGVGGLSASYIQGGF